MGISSSKPQNPIPTYVVHNLPSSTSDNLTLQATHQGEPCQITFTPKKFVEGKLESEKIQKPGFENTFYNVSREWVYWETDLWTVQLVSADNDLTPSQDYVIILYQQTPNGVSLVVKDYKQRNAKHNTYEFKDEYGVPRMRIDLNYKLPGDLLEWMQKQNIKKMPLVQDWTEIKREEHPLYKDEINRIEGRGDYELKFPRTQSYEKQYPLRFV